MPARPIEEVLEAFSREWLSVDGVVGAAIGSREGEKVIIVYATRKKGAVRDTIPETVEGHRVIVEESGRIRAFDPE